VAIAARHLSGEHSYIGGRPIVAPMSLRSR
jgi:hypothetical protein